MSVKVTGSEDRLSLRLPAEGETWVRQGDEMVGATADMGTFTAVREGVAPEGALSPTVLHSEVELDPDGGLDYTLAVGTVNGFRKTIRARTDDGSTVANDIVGAFYADGANAAGVTLKDGGDEIGLVWSAALARWVVTHLSGSAGIFVGS